MAGQRGGFRGDPLHHATVAAEGVNVEPEEVFAVAGVLRAEPLGRDGVSDAHGEALPQRPGRDFHAGRVPVLRMARAAGIQLTERFQVFDAHGLFTGRLSVFVLLHARQMKDRVKERGTMARRKNETVALGPERMRRIVVHDFIVKQVRDRGHAHRRAGVTALGGLNGIHYERADRIDRQGFDWKSHLERTFLGKRK